MSGIGPASCWIAHKRLESWAKAAKERALGSTSSKHQLSSESADSTTSTSSDHSPNNSLRKSPVKQDALVSSSATSLHHQSKSYPGGQANLCRTPSMSSQTSMDSQVNVHIGHRGSSPQIHSCTDILLESTTTSGSNQLRRNVRTPSPLRAISLDIRTSTTTGNEPTTIPQNPIPLTPRHVTLSPGRFLSPLVIPEHTESTTIPPSSPLGAIQPDLYTRKEGPVFLSRLPEDGANIGRLHFRLKYDFDRSDLIVHIIEAHNLPNKENGGFNDPYVVAWLIPEVDNRKRQTIVHRNIANPYFDHHFKFPMTQEDLENRTLFLQVHDACLMTGVVGEVQICMDDFDVTSNLEVWGEINRIEKMREDKQAILLSMSYLPSAERLTVVPMKARNLQKRKDIGIDPFAKVYLIINGKRVKKKKTAVKKSSEPIWNEAITFTLPASNLPNACIECLIKITISSEAVHELDHVQSARFKVDPNEITGGR